MYKKGCENASQSLSISTSEIPSTQTFLSLFPDMILTEPARRDPTCGYARSAYDNTTCTPGFDLGFCSCFPIDHTSLNNTERRTCRRRRLVGYTPANTVWFILTAQYPLTFIFRAATTTVTHTGRWLTDDGLWRNRLSESKQGCISSDPLLSNASQKTISASSWQVLSDAQVRAPPGARAVPQAPLSVLGAREEQSVPWEQIPARDFYFPTSAFSLGSCSHHSIHVTTTDSTCPICPAP